MVAAEIICANFKNNYQAYLYPWTKDGWHEQITNCETLIELQNKYLNLISSPLVGKLKQAEINQKIERFAMLQRMTCDFRYSASVLRCKKAGQEDCLNATKTMVGIFHEVY